MMLKSPTYRHRIQDSPDAYFRLMVKETDLYIHAPAYLETVARELVFKYRAYIESYIERHPDFLSTLCPWLSEAPAPEIIRNMVNAGRKASVGPMAAVAGAIAESVGKELLSYTDEVIVENGGDIFIRKSGPATVGIFAGNSPLSMRIGLRVDFGKEPFSVCTSSGTVGHSLSFGKADAVSVVSKSAALADAAATAVGNHVKTKTDIEKAMHCGKQIDGVLGLVIIVKNQIAAWGNLEIVPLS